MRRLLSLAALIAVSSSYGQIPAGFFDRPLFGGVSGPTCMTFTPDGRIFIAQKTGIIKVYKNGVLLGPALITIQCTSNSERGVLGIAIDPDFATNHFVYVYYTTSANSLNPPPTPKNRVSRFVVNGDTVQAGSEQILLDLIPSDAGNHNAGCIRFGLDGKLYITSGDGGATPSQSQDLNILAGKLMRINPDGTIPNDNPFFNQPSQRGEIWAYGFRNPFRFSFRPGTNVPYVGDVGAVTWEEIDVAQRGGNFGWPNAEGMSNNPAYINPIFTYNHNGNSMSVTGGAFADSPKYPVGYASRYIFADYVLSRFYFLDVTSNNELVTEGDWGPANNPVDFVMGPGPALYYVAIQLGQVRKLTYEPHPTSVTLPASVFGNQAGQGTVTLDVPAPAAGQAVALTSNQPSFHVSPTTTVAPAASSAGFNFTTDDIASNANVTVTATSFGASASKTFVVKPNALKGFYVSATAITTGQSLRAYVGLLGAVANPVTVDLRTDDPALNPPPTIDVPAGASSVGFSMRAGEELAETDITLTATYKGVSFSKTVHVSPAELASFTVAPNPIHGGDGGEGTVTLRHPAPVGGAKIVLSDNTSLIGTPASTTIGSGFISSTFFFTTQDVTVDAVRTMSASYQGVTRTVTITLLK